MRVFLPLVVIALVTVACAGSPTLPNGQPESFTWTVNGQSFAASSNGRTALSVNSGVSLAGADCGGGASLAIRVPGLTIGTYNVGPGAVTVNWTPDIRTGSAANEAWNAPGIPRVVGNAIVSGGSGSVTISSISSDAVSGSFSAEVVANPSNRDTTPKSLQGTFSLAIKDRKIC